MQRKITIAFFLLMLTQHVYASYHLVIKVDNELPKQTVNIKLQGTHHWVSSCNDKVSSKKDKTICNSELPGGIPLKLDIPYGSYFDGEILVFDSKNKPIADVHYAMNYRKCMVDSLWTCGIWERLEPRSSDKSISVNVIEDTATGTNDRCVWRVGNCSRVAHIKITPAIVSANSSHLIEAIFKRFNSSRLLFLG